MNIDQNIGIYRPKPRYRLNIGQNENIGIGICDRYVGANIWYRYRQKYRLGKYIGIGWTNIGPTLVAGSLERIGWNCLGGCLMDRTGWMVQRWLEKWKEKRWTRRANAHLSILENALVAY
jgi:hypothetical protein